MKSTNTPHAQFLRTLNAVKQRHQLSTADLSEILKINVTTLYQMVRSDDNDSLPFESVIKSLTPFLKTPQGTLKTQRQMDHQDGRPSFSKSGRNGRYDAREGKGKTTKGDWIFLAMDFLDKGVSPQETAEILDMSISNLYTLTRDARQEQKQPQERRNVSPVTRRPHLTEPEKMEIQTLRESGMSVREICERVNRSPVTIYKILR